MRGFAATRDIVMMVHLPRLMMTSLCLFLAWICLLVMRLCFVVGMVGVRCMLSYFGCSNLCQIGNLLYPIISGIIRFLASVVCDIACK